MDASEFRKRGYEMIDIMTSYLETIEKRPVVSRVSPGYLRPQLPKEAPNEPDDWQNLMNDVENLIMPGITHWHHPHFFAYFPCANSYPALLADMLSGAIGSIGFTWAASPAYTELEMVMMDWLAKLLHLPEEFQHGGKGGGIIQGTASEATLVALLSARSRAIQSYKAKHPQAEDCDIVGKLIGYHSDQAHSSAQRAGLIAMIKMRAVPSDKQHRMRGEALSKVIQEDRMAGLIPFFCVATLGTTGSCAFDKLSELGPQCTKEDIWLHVDAAFAGSAFICPEYRYLMDGIEHTMSFNFNPHKWMLVNFDCSAFWFRDASFIAESLKVNPMYLKHDAEESIPDFRHWQIPLGRRFRSLKLWFVLRTYGIFNIQNYIRNHICLAKHFEQLVMADQRFEIVQKVLMSLVCFRIKNDNNSTKKLYELIQLDGRIHLVTSHFEDTDVYYLRFAVCQRTAIKEHIEFGFQVIQELTDKVLHLE